ncbi:MAG: ATP-binding protein [Rhodoferax sp.]
MAGCALCRSSNLHPTGAGVCPNSRCASRPSSLFCAIHRSDTSWLRHPAQSRLKHAFPHPGSQEVCVSLQPTGDGARWRLRVRDTDIGLPADFEERRKTSLGLQLVDDSNRQLGGSLEIGPAAPSGAVFSVTFQPKRRVQLTTN